MTTSNDELRITKDELRSLDRISKFELRTSNNGFTLIEVLVAAGIFLIVSGAVVVTTRSSLRSHSVAAERNQAYQLVQEGLEIVRQMRDSQFVDRQTSDWDAMFPASGSARAPIWNGTTRRWELVTEATNPPIVNGEEEILLDGQRFLRTLRFETAPPLPPLSGPAGQLLTDPVLFASNARRITAEVRWVNGGQQWSVSGTTLMTNWKPGV